MWITLFLKQIVTLIRFHLLCLLKSKSKHYHINIVFTSNMFFFWKPHFFAMHNELNLYLVLQRFPYVEDMYRILICYIWWIFAIKSLSIKIAHTQSCHTYFRIFLKLFTILRIAPGNELKARGVIYGISYMISSINIITLLHLLNLFWLVVIWAYTNFKCIIFLLNTQQENRVACFAAKSWVHHFIE